MLPADNFIKRFDGNAQGEFKSLVEKIFPTEFISANLIIIVNEKYHFAIAHHKPETSFERMELICLDKI